MRLALCIALAVVSSCKKEQPPSAGARPAAPEARGAAVPASAPPRTLPTPEVCHGKPDRKVSSATASGQFGGLQVGSYTVALIRLHAPKKTKGFYVAQPPLAWFFVAHRGQPLEIAYDTVEACLWEAGGYQRIDRLTSATAGTVRYEDWWEKLEKDPAAKAAAKTAYEAYLEGPFKK